MAPRASLGGHAKDRAFYQDLRKSLAECCRAEFELGARQGDGASLRTHLQRLAKNTGKPDPRLSIEWPRLGQPLWDVFRRLGRPASMNGAEAITNQEIAAYQSIRRVQLTEWELDTLAMFDAIALEALNKK